MGGRGSSSGGGGGGGAAGAKMPELTGSEKQVAWAENIRQSFIDSANKEIENLEFSKKYIDNYKDATDSDKKRASQKLSDYKEARSELFSDISKISSAKTWIDYRNYSGSGQLDYYYRNLSKIRRRKR